MQRVAVVSEKWSVGGDFILQKADMPYLKADVDRERDKIMW